MPHAEVNILDEMEKVLKFYAWSLNAADFCTGNGHLKRKVSVCFTGSFPYLKVYMNSVHIWLSSHHISPYLFL